MRPEEGPKEKQEAPEAEYLTSRCVLFTYYQGDISSVVDEHFSRALSSYMDGEGKRRPSEQGTGTKSLPFKVAITHLLFASKLLFFYGVHAFIKRQLKRQRLCGALSSIPEITPST